MKSLQNVIDANRFILGENFELIGRAKEVYLSYDRSSGWSVQKFTGCIGLIQKILRQLGFYASTHLTIVRDQLQREPHVPPQLLYRINACWEKQHPIQALIARVRAAPIVRPPLPPVDEPRARVDAGPPHPTKVATRVGFPPNDTLFSIESGNICLAKVKAIVAPASTFVMKSVQRLNNDIHNAAGGDLLAECQKLPIIEINQIPTPPTRCKVGQAVITRSGLLHQNGIERVIHAVADRLVNGGGDRREFILESIKNAYVNALNLAYENGIRTIAFPPLGADALYPIVPEDDLKEVITLGTFTIMDYLARNPGRFNEVKLVLVPELH